MKKLKQILEYIFFLGFRLFLLSIGFERACKFCSYLMSKLIPYMSPGRVAKRNMKKFLKEQFKEEYLDDLYDNYGRYLAEFVHLNSLSQGELDRRIEIIGIDNINQLKANEQPFLLCLAHLANWDFLIRSINKLYPKFSIIYRKANNPYVDEAILKSREVEDADKLRMIAKGPQGARKLVSAIKDKHSIAMLVDQKMNDGLEVPFFGKPAMTANAIAKLSLQYDYPIVPVQIIRIKNSSNFKAIIHPPIDIKSVIDAPIDAYSQIEQEIYNKTPLKDQKSYKIMLHINHLIEDWIRENPGQWFWFHKRWKEK